MMFHLTTSNEEIDSAIAEARSVVGVPLANVEVMKRRARVRDVGTCLVRVAHFEFEATPEIMESLREKMWEGHEALISTITIPHSTHERQTKLSPNRLEAAVDAWHRESEPGFGQDSAAPTPPADRFSKEALMRRFESAEKPKRTFVRPVAR